MLHSSQGNVSGSFHDIKIEIREVNICQELYIRCLSKETKLSIKEIKQILNKKTNLYLSAREVVKMGIADIII